MILKCLVVDDEPVARQIVEKYCTFLPETEIVGSCAHALEAKKFIESQSVDLVFLDINMPVLDGVSFMKALRNPPQVIFTTAYKEYAHQAFDVDACDYLLKPFSLDRFMVAVDKARERLHPPNQKVKVEEAIQEAFTFIKSEGKIYKIVFDELKYAEASGNNVIIVTENSRITTSMTFSSFEALLPGSKFLRLHRSFIINKAKISLVEGNRVFIGSTEIPVGSKYRASFLREIGIKG